MSHPIQFSGGFRYIDEGQGEVLVLLHGLFGPLANYVHTVDYFSNQYRTIVPILPVLDMPLQAANIEGLVAYLEDLTYHLGIEYFTLVGNSLGGHVSINYTLKHPEQVTALVLTGSSGLFERTTMGERIPRRGDYDYIRSKAQKTFYNPELATKDIVDEVYDIVNNREKAIRVLSMAKSAFRNNVSENIRSIQVPVLLIWGENDCITPPEIAEEFHKLIPHSQLNWIHQCGHAAMMEHPAAFNELLEEFLRSLRQTA